MILQFGPEAPWFLHVMAAAALVLHIGGGAVGILSGFTAMFAPKGGRLHRVSGTVFFVAMLSMAGVAAIVAPMLDDGRWTNTTAAVFTLYLIATAWAAVRRPPGQAGWFERAALAVPLGIAAMGVAVVPYGAATGRMDGFATIYMFALVCGLAAVSDIRMIRRGGVIGRDRTVRHLWRMGAALFVAAGSFFFGQQDRIPAAILATPIPAVLGVAPLVLMAFWWIRTRLPRGLKLRIARA
ncbi:MAG: hypothetical protein EPO51_01505 [Phenylobacterium sp.]|uniref:hypothetical protein n=1 Tax=Phenylobacterium sp. TaxID=1871053 RepID=UPI001205F28E|nr:hypothetical protein [Phenylobacterium sp.]TAJ74762.1 MAG: hypothetical protein EPO51_01505 [Phenylobacterium sp.]